MRPCRDHKSKRYITDKLTDPYWKESEIIRKQRIDMKDYMLQPGMPGFNLRYGDPNKRLYAKMDWEEREAWYANKNV